MLLNAHNLRTLFQGFNASFTKGFEGAVSHRETLAMTIPSSTREEEYGWLGQFPGIREWLGDRHIHSLAAHHFRIKNRDFESTIEVTRNDIEDDRLGVFAPMLLEMGRIARSHPDEMLFELIASGFDGDALAYDGQPFFDADHPYTGPDGATISVSNVQAGSSTPWFLIDASRAIKPFVVQQRTPYLFESVTDPNDEFVFRTGKFLYGVHARGNVGYGLWQLAFGSKATLNHDNYEAARAAMQGIRADGGRLLGVKPTHIVVPPSLEGDARRILKAVTLADGESNIWADTAEIIVAPQLA